VPSDVVADGYSAQPAVGRTVVVGAVQAVLGGRETAAHVQAGSRDRQRERRRRLRQRLGRRSRSRLLAVDRRRRAGPVRAVRRVHAAGVRGDTTTVFAAAVAHNQRVAAAGRANPAARAAAAAAAALCRDTAAAARAAVLPSDARVRQSEATVAAPTAARAVDAAEAVVRRSSPSPEHQQTWRPELAGQLSGSVHIRNYAHLQRNGRRRRRMWRFRS